MSILRARLGILQGCLINLPQTSPNNPSHPERTDALLLRLLDFLCDVCHLIQNIAFFGVDRMKFWANLQVASKGPTFSDRVSRSSCVLAGDAALSAERWNLPDGRTTSDVSHPDTYPTQGSNIWGFVQWDRIEDPRVLGSYPPFCRLQNGRFFVVYVLTAFVERRLRTDVPGHGCTH